MLGWLATQVTVGSGQTVAVARYEGMRGSFCSSGDGIAFDGVASSYVTITPDSSISARSALAIRMIHVRGADQTIAHVHQRGTCSVQFLVKADRENKLVIELTSCGSYTSPSAFW